MRHHLVLVFAMLLHVQDTLTGAAADREREWQASPHLKVRFQPHLIHKLKRVCLQEDIKTHSLCFLLSPRLVLYSGQGNVACLVSLFWVYNRVNISTDVHCYRMQCALSMLVIYLQQISRVKSTQFSKLLDGSLLISEIRSNPRHAAYALTAILSMFNIPLQIIESLVPGAKSRNIAELVTVIIGVRSKYIKTTVEMYTRIALLVSFASYV